MSFLRPNTGNEAEDKMAMVPLLFCALPLVLVGLLALGAIVVLVVFK